jgi:hypothetical protein
MATAGEIVHKAAKRMGLYATGQTLRSEIADDLTAAYAEVYAQLDKKEIVVWDFDADVPDELIDDVVTLVCYSRVDEYSIPDDKYRRIVSKVKNAIPNIRALLASNVYKVPTSQYY